MGVHPSVEVAPLYQQFPADAMMGQRVCLIYQAITEPADRTTGIRRKRFQVEIAGFSQLHTNCTWQGCPAYFSSVASRMMRGIQALRLEQSIRCNDDAEMEASCFKLRDPQAWRSDRYPSSEPPSSAATPEESRIPDPSAGGRIARYARGLPEP